MFFLCIFLFYIVLSGIELRRNICVTNGKKLGLTTERKKERKRDRKKGKRKKKERKEGRANKTERKMKSVPLSNNAMYGKTSLIWYQAIKNPV